MSLLTTSKLTKYFGDTHAVDHVDFTVREGEVLALIGSNGAGKTTLVNVISGLLQPDSGTIRFQEADITGASIHEKIARGIARSFQLVNLRLLAPGQNPPALRARRRRHRSPRRSHGRAGAVRAIAEGARARGRPLAG